MLITYILVYAGTKLHQRDLVERGSCVLAGFLARTRMVAAACASVALRCFACCALAALSQCAWFCFRIHVYGLRRCSMDQFHPGNINTRRILSVVPARAHYYSHLGPARWPEWSWSENMCGLPALRSALLIQILLRTVVRRGDGNTDGMVVETRTAQREFQDMAREKYINYISLWHGHAV